MSALYELMRRLDSLTADIQEKEQEGSTSVQPDDEEGFEIPDVFDSDLGDEVYAKPQPSAKAVERVAKTVKSRNVVSLGWNNRWTRMRNVSQLLSDGMRMRADELELRFTPDGYVATSEFIEAIKTAVPQVGDLTELDLKKAILGVDDDVTNVLYGMDKRHQFKTEGNNLYVRCMHGHLAKYYGNGPGLIQLDQIFDRLDHEKNPYAFHDTKIGNIVSIDGGGLISNPNGSSDGGRFVHLWVETVPNQGRKNQDVTYTIDVTAAVRDGVVFYQAANGAVLVESCVPSQYLVDRKVNIQNTDIGHYAPFYDSYENVDRLLLDFASDVLSGSSHDRRMLNLWHVLCPTVERRLSVVEPSIRQQYTKLDNAIRQHHKVVLNIKISFHAKSGAYLLMLNGKNDFDLVKLGKMYGFPRGCPVLWMKGKFIDMRGFYPKFENDENYSNESLAFNETLLNGACSLYFFKKWSGFLLHFIGFSVDEELYWTVCSKKSADPSSEFVIRGRDLMAGILKESPENGMKLLRTLANGHVYIGGEALHVDDEHGYVAKKNAVVVTCVGDGTFYYLEKTHAKADHPCTPAYDTFMKYKDAAEVVQFCNEFKLMCDTSYTLTADASCLKSTVNALLSQRDLLRNSSFEDFVRKSDNSIPQKTIQLITTPGSADHEMLVGDVLEGFVFHIRLSDGNRHTVKVKLPFYTWRTMFLREWLSTVLENGSTAVKGKQFVTVDCASRIEAFVQRWCFTPDGKTLFRKMLKCAAVKLQTQWPLILHTDLGWDGGVVSKRIHVIIANSVENLYFSVGGMDTIEKEAGEFDAMLDAVKIGVKTFPDDVDSCETAPVTICLCVGPIGSGKSTFMERVYESNPSKFELIDGDMVVGERGPLSRRFMIDLTLSLKGERNSTTLSRVWEAVMKGKVPLVSHGGGSFVKFGRGSDTSVVCKLKDRVRQVFGVDANLVVVLMRNSSTEDESTRNHIQVLNEHEFDAAISRVYSDEDNVYMKKVYDNRSAAGEWETFDKNEERAKTQYIATFSKASVGNARCARAIADAGDIVFTAPFQPGAADKWIESVKHSVGLELIHRYLPANLCRPGFFQQLRLIMKEQNEPGGGDIINAACRHTTLQYVPREPFLYNSDQISRLTEKLEGKEFTGVRYMMVLREDDDRSVLYEANGLSDVIYDGLKMNPKPREVDLYSMCKTISVVHIPSLSEFCKTGDIPHVTERTDDLPAKDAVSVISHFQDPKSNSNGNSFRLKHRSGKEFVFDGMIDSKYLYEKITSKGRDVGQRRVIVRGNYVNGTESVTFKCIGVAVFGHEDVN